ncbi:hypothetical protein GQ54DRAFT_209087 [Martensiomyces pterosporus]|nr:hypothetical protein GQ54DRAFT_209087 [Martensiomyces pterosporus]
MDKGKQDCHFFLHGSCRNGSSCPFRHSEGARNTEEICQSYAQTGACPLDDCGKRHTGAVGKGTKHPAEIPCRNEENGGVCTRPDCIFKHSKPHGGAVAGGPSTKPSSIRPPRPSSGLNANAKAFVPQTQPSVAVNSTFRAKSGPAAMATRPQPRHSQSMQWTAALASASTGKPPRPAQQQQLQTQQQQQRPGPNTGTNTAAKPAFQATRAFSSAFKSQHGQQGSAFSGHISKAFNTGATSSAFASQGSFASALRSSPSASNDVDMEVDAATAPKPSTASFSTKSAFGTELSSMGSAFASKPAAASNQEPVRSDQKQNLRARLQKAKNEEAQLAKPKAAPGMNPTNAIATAKPDFRGKAPEHRKVMTIYDILGISKAAPKVPTPKPRPAGATRQTALLAPPTPPTPPAPPAPTAPTAPTAVQTGTNCSAFNPPSQKFDVGAIANSHRTNEALDSADRSASNSPVSKVCYASEFASYVVGDVDTPSPSPADATGKQAALDSSEIESTHETPVTAKAAESISLHSSGQPTDGIEQILGPAHMAEQIPGPESGPAEAVISTTSQPLVQPAPEQKEKPAKKKEKKAANATVASKESTMNKPEAAAVSVPKVRSFQEIMEMKRRKKAEAAAKEAAAGFSPIVSESDAEMASAVQSTASTPKPSPLISQVQAQPKEKEETEVALGKRVLADDGDDAASDASESKRAKPSTPITHKITKPAEPSVPNYVAMFEKEMADLDMALDLSGPLANTPAGDKISKAELEDSYMDADFEQFLSS